jgi:hypothetical protein
VLGRCANCAACRSDASLAADVRDASVEKLILVGRMRPLGRRWPDRFLEWAGNVDQATELRPPGATG